MEDEKSVMQFVGIKPSKALRSFVVRQVEKWMKQEIGILSTSARDSFEILVEKEREHAFSCQIRVVRGRTSGKAKKALKRYPRH